jgi:ABC-type phosphate transport system auxiliary subunit
MIQDVATIEREIEFDVDLDFRIPDLRTLADDTTRLPEEQVRVLYYDTDDLRLSSRQLLLRHEMPNAAGEKHLHHKKGHSWLG